MGEKDKAIADDSEAIRLNPKHCWSYYERALVYRSKGENDKAIADCTEAIGLNPNCLEAYYQRALAYASKGENDKAIADYTEAIRMNPADKGALEQILAEFRQLFRLRADIDPAWLHSMSCWLAPVTRGAENLPGIVWVSDMPWVRSTCGWPSPTAYRNIDCSGATLGIAGFRNVKGIWTHAFAGATPADVVLDISGRKFACLKASAAAMERGGVRFQILIDGRVKHQTQVMRYGAVEPISLDVTGAKEVVLRVLNDGGQGNGGDHAAWGYARFIQAGAEDPLEEPPAKVQSATDANAALFLAEVHWRLHHKELARRWFDKAAAWMDEHQTEADKLRQYRVEAGKLLGSAATPSPVVEKAKPGGKNQGGSHQISRR